MERLRTATRPVVTLLVAVTICLGFMAGRITSAEFLPIGALVIGFWFSDRAQRGGRGS